MSNSSELKTIFNSTDCPSDALLIDYVQQKLNKSEIRAIELHLSDCEMCSDMVDGIMNSSNPVSINNDVSEIQKNIEKRFIQEKPQIIKLANRNRYAIAAIVILLFGIASLFRYLIIDSNKNQVTENKEIQNQEILNTTNNLTDTLDENPKNESYHSIENKRNPENSQTHQNKFEKNIEPLNNTTKNDLSSLSIDANLTSGKATFEGDQKVSDDAILSENDKYKTIIAAGTSATINEESISEVEAAPASLPRSESMSERKETIDSKISKKGDFKNNSLIDSAKKAFFAGNYSSAQTMLNLLVIRNPSNTDALFYLAKSERMLKNYQKSNAVFDSILQNKQSDFLEESQWLKALNLIDLNEKTEAKRLLNSIAQNKGKFSYAAAEILSELND